MDWLHGELAYTSAPHSDPNTFTFQLIPILHHETVHKSPCSSVSNPQPLPESTITRPPQDYAWVGAVAGEPEQDGGGNCNPQAGGQDEQEGVAGGEAGLHQRQGEKRK